MGVNSRIVADAAGHLAAVTPPTDVATPTVPAMVLVDGSGNIFKTTDNGDGTATLNVSGGGSGGGDAVAQNSTTSGESGTLVQGAVTTSAPSYTTAKTNPLSLDTSGNLRVIASGAATAAKQPALGVAGTASTDVITVQGIASGVAQPVSGTVTANIGTAGTLATAAKQPALGTAGTASADVITVQGVASMTPLLATAAGDLAHDAVDSGNPVKIGAQARSTLPTAVSDGDRATIVADLRGRLVVLGSIPELNSDQVTVITSSTAETTIVTADASNKLHVHALIVANSHASTGTLLTLRDGTAGTIRAYLYLPASDTRGFTLPESGSFKQSTANNNWTIQCTTSVASIYVTAKFIKASS